jgi:hypothetical protein
MVTRIGERSVFSLPKSSGDKLYHIHCMIITNLSDGSIYNPFYSCPKVLFITQEETLEIVSSSRVSLQNHISFPLIQITDMKDNIIDVVQILNRNFR